MSTVETSTTDELDRDVRAALRAMLEVAFADGFDETDWEHACGGTHAYIRRDGVVVAHASVVPRILYLGARRLATGYVEAVATAPSRRDQGLGTRVMVAIGAVIERQYDLGALATGVSGFYRRLGWESWRGPTYVASSTDRVRTIEDDDSVMVLRTEQTRDVDVTAELTCEWRAGDVW